MPITQAIQVNKEAVKLLVELHGQREGARLAGLNEDTVCSWAKRYHWKPASRPQAKTGNTQLVDNVAAELAKLESETKSSLARSAAKLARESESTTLGNSGHVHNVAKTAAIVHRWNDNEKTGANVVVNVALLGVDPSTVSVAQATTLDVEPDVSE